MKRSFNPFLVLLISAATLVPNIGFGQPPDELFSFAEKLQHDGLYEAASQQFLKFAMDHPSDERAPLALEKAAECFVGMDSLADAAKVLSSLIDSYPENERRCRNWLKLGRLYHKMQKFEDAEHTYEEMIESSPQCPEVAEAMLGWAEALLALGRQDEAKRAFEKLLSTSEDPRTAPRAYFGLGMAAAGLGDTRGALEAYETLMERFGQHPLSGFAALESARLFLAEGDSSGALGAYRRARSFDQGAIVGPATLEGGSVLEGRGEYEEALAWYTGLLQNRGFAKRRSLYERAVRAAYLSGRNEEVFTLARNFSEEFRGAFSPEVMFFKAQAELSTYRFEDALLDAAALSKEGGDHPRAAYAALIRAAALRGLGKPREAVGELGRFASATLDSTLKVEALERMANVYMVELADTARALSALLEKLDVEKKAYPDEFFRVALSFERARRFEEARRLYLEIASMFPFDSVESKARERIGYIDAFAVLDTEKALKRMEEVASKVLSLPKERGRLELAAARIDVMKDFDGALPLLEEVSSSKDRATRAEALYYIGECHGGLARRALAAGDTSSARERLREASSFWKRLSVTYADSPWAGKAAYELAFLEAGVRGEVDTTALAAALAKYPERKERAEALVMLGDFFSNISGELVRSVAYYREALAVPEGGIDTAYVRASLAEALLGAGSPEESIEVTETLLEARQRGVRLKATYTRARALRALKRYREAAPLFMVLAEELPKGDAGTRATIQAGDCFYMRGGYEKAMDLYSDALDRTRNNELAWEATYRLALCFDRLGETGEALDLLGRCIRMPVGKGSRVKAYENGLRMARALGDEKREGEILQRFAAEFRGSAVGARISRELLEWYLDHGGAEKATELAAEMANAAPVGSGTLEIQALRAMALYRAGRIEEAQAIEDRMTNSGADSLLWEVELQKAWYYFENKYYKKSFSLARHLTESCTGGEDCSEALYLATMSLFSDGSIRQAEEYAGRFFEKHPLSPLAARIHLKFGNALASQNRYSEALAHYREAAESAKKEEIASEGLKNLAISYQKMSRWKEAASSWERFIERFPSHRYTPEATLNAARCRMQAGDLHAAIRSYHDALPRLDSQGKARAYYWSGACYQQMSDFKNAITEYLKVPYLVPEEALWAVTARLKAAECYMRIDRIDSAKKLYRQVIESYGATSDWGKAAAKALEELEKREAENKEKREKKG